MPKMLKFIGCEVLYREACYLAATTPNHVDVEFLRRGLHDLESTDMVAKVQATVDAVDQTVGYEAILLGYARCNDGIVGLRARDIPLVVPRAHDCITLFFGSADRYQKYFDEYPGTYYMTSGWSERDRYGEDAEAGYDKPAYGQQGVMSKLGLTESYEQLVEKYGEDNAAFIAETTGGWVANYSRFLYLEMGICDESALIADTRRRAADNGWEFELRDGDIGLIKKLFAGDWDDEFIIVQPGQQIAARNDERILEAQPAE